MLPRGTAAMPMDLEWYVIPLLHLVTKQLTSLSVLLPQRQNSGWGGSRMGGRLAHRALIAHPSGPLHSALPVVELGWLKPPARAD